MPTTDPDRRAVLNATKLRALVTGHFGDVEARDGGGFSRGAGVTDGTSAWVLADDQAERSLGPALAWAEQKGAGDVHLLVDDPDVAGALARRAACFARPCQVWRVDGRTLVPAVPSPRPAEPTPTVAALELAALITAAGADVTVEAGEVTGEVLGLELARVVEGDDGAARLEVGVGRHDREAFAIVHGDVPTTEALAAVIDAVRSHRHPGAASHPLNQLVPERWLLVSLMAGAPLDLLDGWRLQRVPATVRRDSVKDVLPAMAVGSDDGGAPVVVAVTTGIDLDAVPVAADVREGFDPSARLVLVAPERDAHPVTRRLAASLREPASVLTVPDGWRQVAAG